MKRLPSPSPSLSAPPTGVPENSPAAATSVPASVALTPLSGPLPAVRWAGLDGLRALAVIAVIAYHFFPTVLPGGYIGVDVFFVISGFLITSLLLAEHERSGRISLGRFWTRRVRRLVPPLVPVLLVSASAALLIGGDVLVGLGRQILGAATFSYNWVSIGANASYFATDQPELFRNLWSLAVEEQFYLVWPLALAAVLLIPRPRLRLVLVLALAAASALWMAVLYVPDADPTRVYFGSDTHSFGLAIGAALALALARSTQSGATVERPGSALHPVIPRLLPWLGLGALLALGAFSILMPADSPMAYRGGLVAVSLLSAVAIWAGVRSARFGQHLDAGPLRYLGARSYGIYLWHWPILILLQLAWPTASAHATPSAEVTRTVLIGVLALALTLLAASASYRWVEQPIRRLGFGGSIRRVKARLRGTRVQRQTVWAAALVSCFFLSGATAALAGAPSIASSEAVIERGQHAMEAAAHDAQTPAGSANMAPQVVIPLRAETSDAIAPTGARMSAVGDSVMLASAPELQEAFPGIAIDAAVSRGMNAAPEILQNLEQTGQLRDVVVVGLGTNGPIEDADLQRIRVAIGPNRQLIMVNAFADRDWTPSVNATLADFSAHYRRIELADWSTAIAPHTDVLAEDNIHPGPTGGRIYAETVGSAVARLADLPPGQQPGPNRLLLLPN
ncbi:acyltransferase family protein [Leifsonia sp. YAF41]|uniref:acyltransferase family protein n=1 Tax=Leifsonia sp. YAF41 TaxID=3233086 RepID=UPI003F984264